MIRVLFVGLLFCANLLANRDEVQPFENIGGFVQGTIVHTFTGPDTIQNIRVGDRLLSFDLETSKIVESRVTDTHQEQVDALTRIVVEGEEFYVNPEHRFYVADTHEWVAAKSLLPGFHVLLNKAKKHLIIDKVELVSGKSYIYDLTVEDTRNYFVGKHQVLVHNFAFVIPLFAWTIGEGITFLTAATLGALVTTTVIYAIKELCRYDPGDLSHLSRNFQARDRVDGDRAKADYPVDIYIRNRGNSLAPDSKAQGDHSTFRPGPSGGVNDGHYETWRDKGTAQHPKDPHRWESEKRYDGSGKPHAGIPTPHVKQGKEKTVRPAMPEEIPAK